ncbi:hypothetical protein BUALT_Bualt12G0048000 [Buddleja alternifolia]|uniref:KHG/KDPG aldolase n=1 Tax=Buddleja alternifolia TaxID=168488 RepID=A0AAV6WNX6_9LAMI|nr:hypothetical protein BUALT_Bualt12G0048000 [Buddleja alternifolia]
MAVASSGCNWVLNPPFSSSKIKPFISPSSSHFRCRNSQQNSVAAEYHSTTTVADTVMADIQNSGIIACLRAQSVEVAIEAARAALRGGISVLEVVMSTPGVFEVLQCLVKEYPSTSIGVGTVLDRGDAKNAIRLGAKFLMSPAMVKILFASNAGAKIVKVYPVSALGGVRYIAAIKKPFPRIPMVASQGITIDSLSQYIAEGASSVVLSDAIFDKEAMGQRNFDRVNQLACFAAFQGNEAVERRRTRDRLS